MNQKLHLCGDDGRAPSVEGVHLAATEFNDPPACWVETACGQRIAALSNLHEATLRAVGVAREPSLVSCPACRKNAAELERPIPRSSP